MKAVAGSWYQVPGGAALKAVAVDRSATGMGTPLRVTANPFTGAYLCDYSCGCVWELGHGPAALRWATSVQDAFPPACPNHATSTDAAPSILLHSPYMLFGGVMPPAVERRERKELTLSFDTTPITGWRAWSVIRYTPRDAPAEARLASVNDGQAWPLRRRLEAECRPGKSHAAIHDAPDQACGCGVWAVRDEQTARQQAGQYDATVVGEVALWGRVLEFEHGWRGQYVYPQRLIVLGGEAETARELERLYGVPVEHRPDDAPETVTDQIFAGAFGSGAIKTSQSYTHSFTYTLPPFPSGVSTMERHPWWQRPVPCILLYLAAIIPLDTTGHWLASDIVTAVWLSLAVRQLWARWLTTRAPREPSD